MSTMVTTGDGVHINEGPGWPGQIKIEVERIDISSYSPKPDEHWSFVDASGHFHAYYERKDPWPTLKTRIEVVPCDHEDHEEDCDGANVTHWHCAICDEEIEPGMKPGPHHETMAGMEDWRVKVTVPADAADRLSGAMWNGGRVSVRVELGEAELWGVATLVGATQSTDRTDLELVGVSPLGRRKLLAIVAR